MNAPGLTLADYERLLITRYLAGGMDQAAGARFARGEVQAIESGNHWTAGKRTIADPQVLIIEALVSELSPEDRDLFRERTKKYGAGGINTREAEASAMAEILRKNYTQGATVPAAPDSVRLLNNRPAAPDLFAPATAPGNAEPIREKAPKQRREGLAALEYMAALRIPMIGAYDSGAAIAKGEAWGAAFTADMKIITALRGGEDIRAKGIKIQRFYFLPQAAGFFCLDIDRKNGKDGISEFYQYCEQQGKPRALLPAILRDLPESFPCYVSTPSGGYHLYFRYAGGKAPRKLLSPDTPGVEIKQGAPGLTAPGSYKEGKPYVLHGDISGAPQLPAFIVATLQPPQPKAAAYRPADNPRKEWGRPSWDKIREWTEQDGNYSGRNDKAFSYALHARNHGWSESETIDQLRGEPGLDGLPDTEIETAVHSAYNKGRVSA
jgi:hypothetical protein